MWKDILIAAGVVALMGCFFGLLLYLTSRFFAVRRDERAENLRATLPGVNCGACGYTGCDQYAQALATGAAKTNLCIPGGSDTAKRIAELLGVKAERVEPMVAVVHCNGTCEVTENRAAYAGDNSCRAASLVYGGSVGSCTFGCLGYGDCAAACPVNAICLDNGVARVDRRVCIACGACVTTCPKGIITLIPTKALPANLCSNREIGAKVRKECKNGCIACRKCEKICPTQAITVSDDLAVIDYGKCISCGKCVEVCPVHCIHAVGQGAGE